LSVAVRASIEDFVSLTVGILAACSSRYLKLK